MTTSLSEFKQAAIVNTLRSCRLFLGLSPADLNAIAEITMVKSLDKGDYLFREGDLSHGFYLVQRGAINVHRVSASGKEQVIHIFRAGESFAEATLATMVGYPADARAVEASQVLVWAYRHTTPSVSRARRILLSSLRGATLALLILVLAETVVSVITRTEELPVVAILTDNSRSMGIQDSFEDRRKLLGGVLSSPEFGEVRSTGSVYDVLFDRTARSVEHLIADSISLTGDVTNIAEALRFVGSERRRRNIRAVLLVSDGVVTEGGNPLYEVYALNLPIFAISIGDTNNRRDVRVHTVLSNALAYVDTRVPVAADIRSTGFAGQRVEVLLKDDEGVLDRQVLDLSAGAQRHEVSLWLTPRKPGMRRYAVEVSLPGSSVGGASRHRSQCPRRRWPCRRGGAGDRRTIQSRWRRT